MTLYDYIFSLPVVTEGPVLDCWTCLRMTTRCFRGEYCQGDGGAGLKELDGPLPFYLRTFNEAYSTAKKGNQG